MIGGEVLRARLGDLARSRRTWSHDEAAPPAPREEQAERPWEWETAPGNGATEGIAATRRHEPPVEVYAPRTTRAPLGVESYLPGGEWRDERGSVYVHERLRSEIEHPRSSWGRLPEPPAEEPDLIALRERGLERALFLDLETGGLVSSPVFLAGTMHWNGTDFVLRQYFARHYGEEAALIRALDRMARQFEVLISFNGKSYDAPFLRGRALVHGVDLRLPERHLDLLHVARRRWKHELPNCRLQTLELYVCRRRRSGDVPGDEVPGLYHDYVRRGDPYRLIPVFHHNLLDVITMADLLGTLYGPPRRARPDWIDPPFPEEHDDGGLFASEHIHGVTRVVR